MKTESSKRVFIKVASQEQHENVKNVRKTLKDLQHAASDKENLVGRSKIEGKSPSPFMKPEPKHKKLCDKSVQTEEYKVSAEDLTSDEPSVGYWKILAEKRQEALNESFQENEKLKDQVEALQEENRLCKEMLSESQTLVEVLQEMIEEGGNTTTETELAEEAVERPAV